MFCPKCGKINPDNEEKCSGCGAMLQEEASPAPKKSSRAALKITIAAVVVIATVVVAAILLSGCSSSDIPKETMNF